MEKVFDTSLLASEVARQDAEREKSGHNQLARIERKLDLILEHLGLPK